MKKIYKKKFLNKLIILAVLLLAPITSSAEIGDKKWTKECAKDNKKSCVIAIESQAAIPDSDKKQTLATAIIQLATTVEENKLVPVLTVRFPLNIDLKKKPLVQIDKKKVLNIPFTHCNANEGCVTQISINDEVIKSFKSGKQLTLVMGIYRSEKKLKIDLPLKGFSKAYDSLLK